MSKPRIFLDYASATPVDPAVIAAMEPYLGDYFYNPSSLYAGARAVRDAIDLARCTIATSIGAHADEVIFTSGGTEADNLALLGVVGASNKSSKHIIVSQIEHQAILSTAVALEKMGVRVSYAPVDDQGLIDLKMLASLVTADTILISVMLANNEIGVIQPMKEIAKVARRYNVLLHTDASQAFGLLPIDVVDLHVDLLTINSGKVYGPKGAGALFVKRGIVIQAVEHGGSQERGLRPGTENVAAIVGFAKACELVQISQEEESARLTTLRDKLIKGLLLLPGTKLNGHPTNRLANNINVAFSAIEGDAVLLFLDEAGIMVSAGSACKATDVSPSHVLVALGRTDSEAKSSLRFSLGRGTTVTDIDYVLEVLPSIVEQLRK